MTTVTRNILYVIGALSNPVRYDRRYQLFDKWKKYMLGFPNLRLYTVEMAFGERGFYTGPEETMQCVQLRSYEELWHKENMINLAVARLPDDWEYVAWIDTDIMFSRPDWVDETIHQLQHYMFVQMFETAIDLGPTGQALKMHNSMIANYLRGASFAPGYLDWHPGFAWAARREAWDAVGGLFDQAVLGSGDRHMACAMIGKAPVSYSAQLSKGYKDAVLNWEDKCDRYIKRDVGFVQGTILHQWHGKKRDRGYQSRWKILESNKFNPVTDLKRDWQGLWQLEVTNDRQIELRDDIRRYFRSRNEDSIDLA
jgi:hypothetical protein